MTEPAGSRASKTIFVLCLVFLAFVGGALTTVAKVFPSDYVRNAYRGGTALMDKMHREDDPFASDLWARQRTTKRGVTVYDQGKAQPGLTLYTSGNDDAAMLIDIQGHVVHKWRKPYSAIWDKKSSSVKNPVPDDQTYFRKAHVFPNGDLLAIYIGYGDSPYGYGMVKLDKDSNVIWKNLHHFHHDFDIGPDGRIYGLTHRYRHKPLKDADQFTPPFMEDFLVVLSPDGKELKRISLLDAMNQSGFRRLLWRIHYYSMEDPMHTNGVDLLDAKTAARLAKKIPGAKAGQVLLSFRELAGGSIALLDVDSGKFIWATNGQWLSQHDPDVLPNGDIQMFDNRGHYGPGGKSRIIRIDPATGGIVWQYHGTQADPLQSDIRSAQEQLPNGDTLITESNGGRVLEITPQGDTVWQFINPVRGGKDDKMIPVVSWAQRLPRSYFDSGFRAELTKNSLAEKEVQQ